MTSYQLYQGDCLEIMPTLEAGSVDAVVTDPPYGVGFAEWDDKTISRQYSLWLEEMMRVSIAVTFTCGWARLADWCIIKKPTCFLYWYKPGAMGFGPFGFTHIDPMPVYGKVKMVGNTDVIRAPIIPGHQYHVTQKPIEWAKGAITRLTRPGDTVLDPFMGSGTTGVACGRLGRNFIGIELDPDYYRIAEQRIKNAYGDYVPTDKEKANGQISLFEVNE